MFVRFVDAQAPASVVGGKAASLGRLAAAGLPTPPAFVVTDAVFRHFAGATEIDDPAAVANAIATSPFPVGFAEALAAGLAALGEERLAVRSSFAGEDDVDALAAGVYESRVDVARDQVEAAVRAVLASAVAPAARAYAGARGKPLGRAPVAVLVHGFRRARAAGHAALEGPGEPPIVWTREGAASPGQTTALGADLARLRELPAEVEWVEAADGSRLYVQLRPYRPVHRPPAAAWAGFDDLPPHEAPAAWTWDAAHNPWPLSAAHAGLVELVDAACAIGIRQRVLGGYLFWSRAPGDARHEVPEGRLRALWDDIRAKAESALVSLGPTPALEQALTAFLGIYEPLLGVLGPALRKARARFAELAGRWSPGADIAALLGHVPSRATARRERALAIVNATDADRPAALAAFLAEYGDEAAAWDLSEPTWAEAPDALLARVAGLAVREAPPEAPRPLPASLPAAARAELEAALVEAREALALGEDDDWLYARMQAAVRRAVLVEGRRLVAAGALGDAHDVFDLPLARIRAIAAAGEAPAELRDEAAAGRRRREAQMGAPPQPTTAHGALTGHGTGGRAVGRVHVHVRGTPVPPGCVLVARSLLPTELPLVAPIAIVTETGGPLDHVAAQARERGLPAIVGVAGATTRLETAMWVLVDADRGEVIVLGSAI